MLFLLAGLATLGGVFFAALPEVVRNDILQKFVEALSSGAHGASTGVAKAGAGMTKFLIRGTVATTVAVVGFAVLDKVADERLQLPDNQLAVIREYWDEVDAAAQASDVDPYMIAAVWRVEHSLLPTGPSNGQGIGGFYSAVQAGEKFPVGKLSDEEILSELTRIGNILHSKCRGMEIGYSSMDNNSEDHMWERAECFATYNGSQGSLVQGVYSSNGQVFNNLPGHPDTKGLTICITDGCSEVGTMVQDGYETGYRKIRAHVVSHPEYKGGVSDPILAIGRVTDKVSGELERLAVALDAQTVSWGAQDLVEEAQAAVVKPPPEGKLAWPAPSNTWIQFKYGNPKGYTAFDFHNGVDIDSPGFKPFMVTSASAGKVTYAGDYDACNRGVVVVQWTRGMVIKYVHLDPEKLEVKAGDEVSVGQNIGKLWNGTTSCSDGPHLHFMVLKNGVSIDPQPYLVKKKE